MTPPQNPKRRRRWAKRLLVAALLLGAWPAFVLGTVYSITLRCELPGGRHGPRDAYRHGLASAIVAYTASPRLVEWVTDAMEGDGLSHRMDAHNNHVGASIGAAAPGWHDMLRAVRDAIDAGREAADGAGIDADPARFAWLPRDRWRERAF